MQNSLSATSGFASALAALSIAPAIRVGDLTMFPLVSASPGDAWHDTLADAVAAGRARVTETSVAGSVPELCVINDGARPVLIVDGEELIGAKQNRIVNLTVLVPAATSLTIPVTCVEARRWKSRGWEMAAAGRAFHAAGRRDKLAQVNASMRTSGARHSDQGAVWREVAEKSARLDSPSDTGAASAMFERHAEALQRMVDGLRPIEGQVGAVFAVRGHISGLDAFDDTATWARLLPTIVRSYGLDALDAGTRQATRAGADPLRLLNELRGAPRQLFPGVGAGTDVRFESAGVVGGALMAGERLVHLLAFPR